MFNRKWYRTNKFNKLNVLKTSKGPNRSEVAVHHVLVFCNDFLFIKTTWIHRLYLHKPEISNKQNTLICWHKTPIALKNSQRKLSLKKKSTKIVTKSGFGLFCARLKSQCMNLKVLLTHVICHCHCQYHSMSSGIVCCFFFLDSIVNLWLLWCSGDIHLIHAR